jgi:hypothetical protein
MGVYGNFYLKRAIHPPSVHNAGERWNLRAHGLESVGQGAFQRTLDNIIGFCGIEGPARLDSDPPHPRDEWLVRDVRWVELHQFCYVRKVLACGHGIDLCHRWTLHVHSWINRRRDQLGSLAKLVTGA